MWWNLGHFTETVNSCHFGSLACKGHDVSWPHEICCSKLFFLTLPGANWSLLTFIVYSQNLPPSTSFRAFAECTLKQRLSILSEFSEDFTEPKAYRHHNAFTCTYILVMTFRSRDLSPSTRFRLWPRLTTYWHFLGGWKNRRLDTLTFAVTHWSQDL